MNWFLYDNGLRYERVNLRNCVVLYLLFLYDVNVFNFITKYFQKYVDCYEKILLDSS